MNLKKLIGFGTLVASSCSAIYFNRTLFFIDEFAAWIELKENGQPVAVPRKIDDLIQSVMKDMKLKSDEINLIKAIRVAGKNLTHFGYSGREPGAYLSVPQTFATESGEMPNLKLIDKKFSEMTENPESIENFKSVLYVPDEAKKFAIAHEIYKSKNFTYYILGILPIVIVFEVSVITLLIYKFNSSRVNKYPAHFVSHITFTALLLYFIMKISIEKYRTNDADYQAATLGKEYIEGGIAFYEKLQARDEFIDEFNKKALFYEQIKSIKNFLSIDYFSERINYLKEIQKSENISEKKPNF